MKTFRKHLDKHLKDPKFRELFNEEKELVELSLKLQSVRKKSGITQNQIAEKTHLTQQQLSKIEGGENCNIMTYLKASRAVGYKLTLEPIKLNRRLAHA